MNQRRLELGLQWRDLAAAAGISYEALRSIRRGVSAPADLTARKLDDALQWEPGSVRATLAGGTPALRQSDPTTPAPVAPTLTPGEALRRMIRASARELGATRDDVDEAFTLARQDLADLPPAPGRRVRTDLSDMVRERRLQAGLSVDEVAAHAVDPATGEHVVDADWLDRLERSALAPHEYPEYPQLDALVGALNLDPDQVQGAAGVQFMDVHTVWSDDGQARAIVHGELSPEDRQKVQTLMQMYRPAPRRDG
ncbi:hypothetical protein OQI_33860 [Streptomyces pharetrae CZA14]|uniref:HTH cro/C1-type domain-containing protein n=2 Tax=Streptomyces pharetrae TaxID=291370 RepID=A0ABX3Y8V2_9ACTN|nr:hypothetical protein OQI_33860 [Streptomyces pharetrae CZA14]